MDIREFDAFCRGVQIGQRPTVARHRLFVRSPHLGQVMGEDVLGEVIFDRRRCKVEPADLR